MKRHSTGKNGLKRDKTQANAEKRGKTQPANAANPKPKKQTLTQKTKSKPKKARTLDELSTRVSRAGHPCTR